MKHIIMHILYIFFVCWLVVVSETGAKPTSLTALQTQGQGQLSPYPLDPGGNKHGLLYQGGHKFNFASLPVQHFGRIKPFETFAQESLAFIYGKKTFKGRLATDVILSILFIPHKWDKQKIVHIPSFTLKKALDLEAKKKVFSPEELLNNQHFIRELSQLQTKRQSKIPLDKYFKLVQELESKLILYQAIQQGKTPGLMPSSTNQNQNQSQSETDTQTQTKEPLYTNKGEGHSSWLPYSKLNAKDQKIFHTMVLPYLFSDTAKDDKASIDNVRSDNTISDKPTVKNPQVQKAFLDFQTRAISFSSSYLKDTSKIPVELHYNWLNPFRWAWVLYLLGCLLALSGYIKFNYIKYSYTKDRDIKSILKTRWFYVASFVFVIAFVLQGYGMVLRSIIMSRPPVTNMYETVIWVPWITTIFGMILSLRKKIFSPFLCSAIVACFCLLLADFAPSALDGRLQPLEAVLRSSFWLVVHVLTITMSYGAFFMAFALGNVALFLFLKPDKNRDAIKLYLNCIERSLQVGIILLAAGTVLGGVWADYSWGRFWGWDPKETWALISLLCYLALLHGRLIGYVRDFGMAVGSVLLFFSVVMAWYGVNYVLGQGLHSYGFGAGGVEYVAGLAVLQVAYVLVIGIFRHSQKLVKNP